MDLALWPTVWDHKTSGNPEVWAIGGTNSDPEPLQNLQGAMYLYAASRASRGKPVSGLWVIHHTKSKTWKPRVVGSFDVTPARAREAFGDLVHISGLKVYEAMRKAKCAEDMEPKLESCYAYGKPCPALAFCTVDRREHLTKAFDGGSVATMGLFTSEPVAEPPVNNTPVLPGPYETATVGRDPAADRAAYSSEDHPAGKLTGPPPAAVSETETASPGEGSSPYTPTPAPGPGTHGKQPPQDLRGLSEAGRHVLNMLTQQGPMDFASSAKSATERRPFVNLRTLKAMSAKNLIVYVENDDFRSVRLPHHPEQPAGYTPAPAVNAPETSRMSDEEKDTLSRAVLTNSEELKRRAAREADIQSATDSTVRALLPAVRAIVDYASAHGVDLIGELDVSTTTETSS